MRVLAGCFAGFLADSPRVGCATRTRINVVMRIRRKFRASIPGRTMQTHENDSACALRTLRLFAKSYTVCGSWRGSIIPLRL
jgi:hypothetical protein